MATKKYGKLFQVKQRGIVITEIKSGLSVFCAKKLAKKIRSVLSHTISASIKSMGFRSEFIAYA
ncbi:hypothetical protein [Helicobacter cetorum]|uniref:hypothetical protein n=1 Tax=Helicobacter cetorum TaxID=138563 RepID=UPI000CF0EB28|nr:hypothetical protein [Helicobacter cetorum]